MSWTQDQLGPIARTVEDAKTVFEVIAGFYDEEDNVTAVLSLMIALTVACTKVLLSAIQADANPVVEWTSIRNSDFLRQPHFRRHLSPSLQPFRRDLQ